MVEIDVKDGNAGCAGVDKRLRRNRRIVQKAESAAIVAASMVPRGTAKCQRGAIPLPNEVLRGQGGLG
jgi:hypothetical protein